MSRRAWWPAAFLAAVLAVPNAYLLGLLIAAKTRRRARPAGAHGPLTSFVVVVPAHNEVATVSAAVQSLRDAAHPSDQVEVVVIADRCTDDTARVAQDAGATVWERRSDGATGKGSALAWGLERLWAEGATPDAIAFVDADCVVSKNFFRCLDETFRAGASAVQVRNVVSNPGASPASALAFAAFTAGGVTRPLGKTALGLSSGLFGTGMAFRRALLERHGWRSFSVGEDQEQHARLVLEGERVEFEPRAMVASRAETSLSGSREQQLRWETSRWDFVRRWTPRLVRRGVVRRDIVALHAGLEPLVPPQSILGCANLLCAGAAAWSRSRGVLAVATINLLAHASFVVGGLLLVRAPASVYRSLLRAPLFVVFKLSIHGKLALRRTPAAWVASVREEGASGSATNPSGD